MISKRIFLALAVVALMAVSNVAARAQSSDGSTDPTQQMQNANGGLLDAIEQAKQAQIKNFTGSWEGVVTPEVGGPPPFLIFFTFGGDGTVVATDTGPPNATLNTSEHGGWERTGDNEFTIIYKQFILTGDGSLDSVFKGRVKFKLNPNTLEISGVIKVDFYDPQGHHFLSGEGTIKCTKIRVESLN